MSKLASWSPTSASNNSPAPNGWPEGTMYVPEINNVGREMMGAIKGTFWDHINAVATSTGSSNAYTLSYTYQVDAVSNGQVFLWIANHTNSSTTPTLTVGTDTAKTIKRFDGSAVVAGDITSGNIVITAYDGTNFRLLSPTKNVDAATLTGTTTIPSGANQNVSGNLAIKTGGTLVVESGGTLTIASGGSLSVPGTLTVPSGGTLNASAGTLTLADNQISGDKVSGGTIDNVSLSNALVSSLSSPLAVAYGGTGATTAAAAKTNLGFVTPSDIGVSVQGYDVYTAKSNAINHWSKTQIGGGTYWQVNTSGTFTLDANTHPNCVYLALVGDTTLATPTNFVGAGTTILLCNNSGAARNLYFGAGWYKLNSSNNWDTTSGRWNIISVAWVGPSTYFYNISQYA